MVLDAVQLEDDTQVPRYSGFNPVCRSPKVSSIVTLTRVARTGGKPARGKVEIQRETSERTSRGKSIAEN